MKKIFAIAAMALLTLTASAQKLARVNFNELVMLCPDMDAAREVMNASQKEAEETNASMVEEYQSKLTQYQQKQAQWTPAIRESKERELMEIQNRIQQFQQSVAQELQEQQANLIAPIQEKAQKAVQDLAKAQGITVVFDASSALYFDETAVVDLTPAARLAMGIPEGRTIEQLQQELAAQAQAQ